MARIYFLVTVVALAMFGLLGRVSAAVPCFSAPDPSKPRKLVARMRDIVKEPMTRRQATNDNDNEPGFVFRTTCEGNSSECQGFEDGLKAVGSELSRHFKLRQSVIVNATYTNFCTAFDRCAKSGEKTIGKMRDRSFSRFAWNVI